MWEPLLSLESDGNSDRIKDTSWVTRPPRSGLFITVRGGITCTARPQWGDSNDACCMSSAGGNDLSSWKLLSKWLQRSQLSWSLCGLIRQYVTMLNVFVWFKAGVGNSKSPSLHKQTYCMCMHCIRELLAHINVAEGEEERRFIINNCVYIYTWIIYRQPFCSYL